MENPSVFTWSYPVVLNPDDNGTWLITAPDIPELTTWAPIDDLVAAIQNARNALVAALAARVERGEDIPTPSPAKGRLSIIAPTLVGLKVALYRAMRMQRITQKEMARRIGCDPKDVRRLLDLTHNSRSDIVDRALLAAGVQPPTSAVEMHAVVRDRAADVEIKKIAMSGAEIQSLRSFVRKQKLKSRS
jgi:antitoxin HicB